MGKVKTLSFGEKIFARAAEVFPFTCKEKWSRHTCQAVARFFMLVLASKLQRTAHRLLFPSQQVSMQISICLRGRHTDPMT